MDKNGNKSKRYEDRSFSIINCWPRPEVFWATEKKNYREKRQKIRYVY